MIRDVYRFVRQPSCLIVIGLFAGLFFITHMHMSTIVEEKKLDSRMIENRYAPPKIRTITEIVPSKMNEKKHSIAANPVDQAGSHRESSGDPVFSHPKHPILGLSSHDYVTTSLDVMMSWYGEADGGGSCAEDFGNSLINRWRSTRKTNCDPLQNSLHSSRIDCYLVQQTRHHGNGDNLCVMKNVSVNLGVFGQDSSTRTVVQNYVNTRHNDQPYIKFKRGFIKGACTPIPEHWQDGFMPGWNRDLTTAAFESVSNIFHQQTLRGANEDSSSTGDKCDKWIDHSVLIVQRDTFANFFHDSEDFFNVFIAFAILRWKFSDAQIFLTDLYPRGPFWDMWAKPFSGSRPTLDAWNIRQLYGSRPDYRVCFRELAVGIYGPASPITVASWETPCSNTALVRAYSDYIIRGLDLQNYTHYAQPSPSKEIIVTYLARRSSTVWPEKKFCNDSQSFFLCDLWKDWGIRSLGRVIQNDNELVKELKSLESRTYLNNAIVKFQDVDYNILTFEDQIKVDLSTDILIGPHGAGLMHNIFMRDRAVLMELSIDGSGIQRHFHNLARWYGRTYYGINCNNPINVNSLRIDIVRAIEAIKLDSY